jgi:hypothetical protein
MGRVMCSNWQYTNVALVVVIHHMKRVQQDFRVTVVESRARTSEESNERQTSISISNETHQEVIIIGTLL